MNLTALHLFTKFTKFLFIILSLPECMRFLVLCVPKYCRTEAGFFMDIEKYNLDTCARCYNYMPQWAFVNKYSSP
ncbi:uncharacterized protein B4U80_02205 [Leptotrombidium deliense]|uniref:Secreted protein n=1 Tax=Leptotrombidium deliense TaxID=299467 RepID=A0A443SKK6_9ACAR|nr:uncharacterized protein B4U80_02205 [Leptotrombidium deliense]